ncbi:unnamed protein product [Orchesella dallaii]|uniref:Uncharacterized protein n=1 Tax=Orchesella dallaii TaxID=48710 RepID=A0ABP1PWQ6_9HEXA
MKKGESIGQCASVKLAKDLRVNSYRAKSMTQCLGIEHLQKVLGEKIRPVSTITQNKRQTAARFVVPVLSSSTEKPQRSIKTSYNHIAEATATTLPTFAQPPTGTVRARIQQSTPVIPKARILPTSGQPSTMVTVRARTNPTSVIPKAKSKMTVQPTPVITKAGAIALILQPTASLSTSGTARSRTAPPTDFIPNSGTIDLALPTSSQRSAIGSWRSRTVPPTAVIPNSGTIDLALPTSTQRSAIGSWRSRTVPPTAVIPNSGTIDLALPTSTQRSAIGSWRSRTVPPTAVIPSINIKLAVCNGTRLTIRHIVYKKPRTATSQPCFIVAESVDKKYSGLTLVTGKKYIYQFYHQRIQSNVVWTRTLRLKCSTYSLLVDLPLTRFSRVLYHKLLSIFLSFRPITIVNCTSE